METAKDEVRRILDALPEDATLEGIQYRIYMHQAIDAGLRDIAEGRTLSQEEAERRYAATVVVELVADAKGARGAKALDASHGRSRSHGNGSTVTA